MIPTTYDVSTRQRARQCGFGPFRPSHKSNARNGLHKGLDNGADLCYNRQMETPGTYVVHSRHDIRIIASLARFFNKNSVNIRSRGELIRQAVNMIYDLLLREKMVDEIESFTDAQEALFILGFQTNHMTRKLVSKIASEAVTSIIKDDLDLRGMFEEVEKETEEKKNEQTKS